MYAQLFPVKHVQVVLGTREVLNIFDIIVPVLNFLQPLDSAKAAILALHSKAFWRGAACFSRTEAFTFSRLVPPLNLFLINQKLQ